MPACPPWAARPPEPGGGPGRRRQPLSRFGVELIGANLQADPEGGRPAPGFQGAMERDRRGGVSVGIASRWKEARRGGREIGTYPRIIGRPHPRRLGGGHSPTTRGIQPSAEPLEASPVSQS